MEITLGQHWVREATTPSGFQLHLDYISRKLCNSVCYRSSPAWFCSTLEFVLGQDPKLDYSSEVGVSPKANKETSSLQADISLVIRQGCSLCRVSQVVVAVFQDFFLTWVLPWNIEKFRSTNFGTTAPQEFNLLAFYQTPNDFIIGLS